MFINEAQNEDLCQC